MAQDIQVLGKRNEKDKLSDINLTRSICLNDLTQEQLARLYKKGVMTFSDFFSGCKLFYNCQYRGKTILLNVERVMFDSANQTVVFECGYSMVHDKYFRVLLNKDADGQYLLSPRVSDVPWLTSDDLKTVNGQSLVGTGDIEIAAGVESLNGQTGNISLKTVNGNELIGTGDIEIKGGGDATPTGTTLYFTTTDGQTLNANIEAKNKAGTVIEPSLKTPTAWYYDEIVETMGFPSNTTNCNLYSLNGVNIPVGKVINNYYTNSVIRKIMQNCRYADLRKFFFSGYSRELSTMFWGAKNLEWVDIPYLNTYKTTKMDKMFYDCSGLTTLDVSNWNTSQVTDMSDMFHGCRSLTSLDVSKWDTSKFVYMRSIFAFCSALTSLDLSNWNTSNVTNMSELFRECGRLTSLDLSNWDLTNLTSMGSMFEACNSLKTITMKNCTTETIDKIKSALQSAGILDKVTIITS